MSKIAAYEKELYRIVRSDWRYIVMTAENLASIRSLPGLLGERFVDTGISEQTLVGAAAGLALRGRVPVIHALAAFLTMRAYEFIRTDIGIAGLPVKLVGSVPGFLSTANGPTHQAVEDIAIMSAIPSMQIFCPADEEDLVIGLRSALENPFPTYIRLNEQPASFEHSRQFCFGESEIVITGDDLTIMSYGLMMKSAFAAAELLKSSGISVRLINLRTVKPIDREAITRAAMETGFIVTIEDHLTSGGLASIVKELLFDKNIKSQVLPFCLKNYFEPGSLDQVIEREGLSGPEIASKVQQALSLKGGCHV